MSWRSWLEDKTTISESSDMFTSSPTFSSFICLKESISTPHSFAFLPNSAGAPKVGIFPFEAEHILRLFSKCIIYHTLCGRHKTPNVNCFCTSSPLGDIDVKDKIDLILQLCQENKPKDTIHLSRWGTKWLLGTINGHIPAIENFEKCVFTPYQSYPISNTNAEEQTDTRQSKQGHHFQPRGRPFNTQPGSAVYQGSARPDHNWHDHY